MCKMMQAGWGVGLGLWLAGLSSVLCAQDKIDEPALPKLPFISIDTKQRLIDVDAAVCLREGPLELIATVHSGKEHESIVVFEARPQNVHLALLMLGLEPGSPGTWEEKDGKAVPVPATGSRVSVSLLIEKDGKVQERPIHEFVHNPVTKKTMSDSVFVFAGSRIARPKTGEPFYAADVAGNVISLVTFSDEMLSRPLNASKVNEQLEWMAKTDAIPELGQKVKLRIRALDTPKEDKAGGS